MDIISFDVEVSTVIIQLISTLVIFLVVSFFVAKPMRNFLAKRQAIIQAEFDEAETAKEVAFATKEELNTELAKLKANAQQLMEDASAKAQVKYDNILETAKNDAEDQVQKARRIIEREREAMLYDAKKEIAKQTSTVASKLIKKEIDASTHDDLFDDFVQLIGGGASG